MEGPATGAPGAAGLLARARATIARHALLRPGDRVLVAVSGGPDSVALLDALLQLRAEYGLTLAACHVHHGLRPEADADAAFVEALARGMGCSLRIERVTVRAGGGRSPEDAARAARHEALGRVAAACGAGRIALGHTADDQAETVLMRLLQGAGPRGLAGMPVCRGRLIRPLLDVDRGTVLAHLRAAGLPWVEDATNRDRAFLRNRVRHALLPLLRLHGGDGVPAALLRTARASRETFEALDALVAPRLDGLGPTPVGATLPLFTLAGLPAGATKALLRLALGPGGPAGLVAGGLRSGHLDALTGLLAAPVGALVRLPGARAVERGREALWILAPAGLPAVVPVAVPGSMTWGHGRLALDAELVTPSGDRPANPLWEAWFDAAGVAGPLGVRARRPGDRMVPFGAGHAGRLDPLLAAAGIPPRARRAWPVVVHETEAGDEILWLIGVRRAAVSPVTAATRVVLRLRAAALLAPGLV